MTRIIVRAAEVGGICRVYIYYGNVLAATTPCGRLEELPAWLLLKLERARMLDTLAALVRRLRPGEERMLQLPFYA